MRNPSSAEAIGGSVRRHACGMRTAWTQEEDAAAAVAAIATALGSSAVAQLIVFFSPQYDAPTLCSALNRQFEGVPVVGCTTSGGICPDGRVERGMTVIAFPVERFRIVSAVLPDIHHLDVEGTAQKVRALRQQLDRICGDKPEQRFALTLIDGLANVEETVVSAVTWALDGIPLIGGSAGDDLRFADTVILFDSGLLTRAAVLILVDTDCTLQLFKTDNFEPTATKFVVTSADEEARIVREFNAEPAAREYAMAVGLDPDELTPMSFAAHPLVVKIGGEYFCRSIRHLNADGSLSFFCAIGEGVVMTLAQPLDIVQATEAALSDLDDELGGIDILIGFDCVHRRIDAEVRQVGREIADLYRRFKVVGCETYGEQYRAMHLNQTFTGVGIGLVARPSSALQSHATGSAVAKDAFAGASAAQSIGRRRS